MEDFLLELVQHIQGDGSLAIMQDGLAVQKGIGSMDCGIFVLMNIRYREEDQESLLESTFRDDPLDCRDWYSPSSTATTRRMLQQDLESHSPSLAILT